MHMFTHSTRRRFMRRYAHQMAKPSVRTMVWVAGVSAAGSLLYYALRKRYS